ncbi:MAG: hypothetical protein ACKV2V_16060 [Blastocatellia bacterium]
MKRTLTLEREIEQERDICEEALAMLRENRAGRLLLPDDYQWLRRRLAALIDRLDKIQGMIATIKGPLRNAGAMSDMLLQKGAQPQAPALVHRFSHERAITDQMIRINQRTEERIQALTLALRKYNQSVRTIHQWRDRFGKSWLMDRAGMPGGALLPAPVSLRSLDELAEYILTARAPRTVREMPRQDPPKIRRLPPPVLPPHDKKRNGD